MKSQSKIAQELSKALEMHRVGRLDQAAAIYRKVLARDPKNFDAGHLLGLVAFAQKQFQVAISHFDRAIQLNPGSALARYNRALTLTALGQIDQAIADYRSALQIDPNHADSLLNLAALLHRVSDFEGAVQTLNRYLVLRPNESKGLMNLARCLRDLKRYDEAESLYQKALLSKPGSPEVLFQLAHVQRESGRLQDAIQTLEAATRAQPETAEFASTLGNWFSEMGRHEDAMTWHKRALAIAPHRHEIHFNFGNALYAHGQFTEAALSYRRALEIRPDHVDTLNNLGEACKDAGDFDGALAAFEKAIILRPDGLVADNKSAALINKALTLLSQGKLDEGWRIYRHRYDHSTHMSARRWHNLPEWTGELITEKKLLLWTDQGIGDEILYASMIQDIANVAGTVILECEPRLVTLFQRSFPTTIVVPRQEPPHDSIQKLSPDVQLAVPDLGGQFRQNPDKFPHHRGYLKIDEQRYQALRAKYLDLANGQKLVGFSWRSASLTMGRQKSIPLSSLEPLLRLENCKFLSLQYGATKDELDYLEEFFAQSVIIDHSIDALTDLDGFAAQVAAMDAIFSVSNTTVHFAGALGRPVSTLVPAGKGALWYFRFGERTPWYPSMKIFRQRQQGDWTEVISRAVQDLRAV